MERKIPKLEKNEVIYQDLIKLSFLRSDYEMIIKSDLFTEAPLVSVVIPSYNRADTVGEAIDSILAQTCHFDFEIVIGDDCSTDHAREVLQAYRKKHPDRIKLLFQDVNVGLGANWALCVKECKGKYLCTCDNDDYWHNPDKLQLQVDFMEANPERHVVITNHRCHSRDTGKFSECQAYIDRSVPLQQAVFSGKTAFCNATIMYRYDFLVSHIHLDDYIQHQFTLQDWNTWVILSAYTDFSILPVSTATFGVETESITRPKSYESIITRFRKEKACYKYVCGLFPAKLIFDEKGYDSYVYSILMNLAYHKLDFEAAQKYASKMKALNSSDLKIKMTTNRFTFYLFAWLKRLRKKFTV